MNIITGTTNATPNALAKITTTIANGKVINKTFMEW